MIANALNDKPLPVYGTGENVRDWLYVEDHCKAIDLIIHKGRVGEVYNVGGHNEMSNLEIVKLVCKELGKPESLITFVADRKGHDMRYAIDPAKIYKELGWLPETKFADGVKKTVKWYLENREWWESDNFGRIQKLLRKNVRKQEMKVLVTGVKGQLGYDVVNELNCRGHVAVGVDKEEMDVTDEASVARVLNEVKPEAVIHCAAWTAVDAAEDNEESVRLVNAVGTENIVLECKKLGCKLLYVSTDYVFDGRGDEPWQPDCKDYKPLNIYGKTKLEGELAVAGALEKFLLFALPGCSARTEKIL